MVFHIHNETEKPAKEFSVERWFTADVPREIIGETDREYDARVLLHHESHKRVGEGKRVDWKASGDEFEVGEHGKREVEYVCRIVTHR